MKFRLLDAELDRGIGSLDPPFSYVLLTPIILHFPSGYWNIEFILKDLCRIFERIDILLCF